MNRYRVSDKPQFEYVLSMDYIIREMQKDEIHLLHDFLYEVLFISDWYTKEVPRDIIYTNPLIHAAIKDFGTHPDNYCYVAEVENRVVGSVWVGFMNEYGHIDNETPYFSISLYKEYRGKGIGTALMKKCLNCLKDKGCKRASLGVNKEIYAVRMYKKVGFEINGGGTDETEYLMVCNLS